MIEVVCGVLIQNGKCLIARRNYGSSKGFYEFPGGKVESNETKEEALKREWKEELGIEIKNISYLASSQDQQDYAFSLTCFTCQSDDCVKSSNAHDHLIWTTPDHIYDFNFFESDQKLVDKLKEIWPCIQGQKKPKY